MSPVRISRGFRPPDAPRHAGMDLTGQRGSPILAAHEGIVIYAGSDFRGYGKMILVEYNSEWATLYAHLEHIAVKEGHIVSPGDPLGGMGSTGKASGVHLHFELMRHRRPVDPLPLLTRPNQIARAHSER
ncbi:MAG: M23 family metallopeptidase [Calothrix sp. SM1_5_4]|nr:M23 family metallopeptidase [Calothrix sp. SM1_5_4]